MIGLCLCEYTGIYVCASKKMYSNYECNVPQIVVMNVFSVPVLAETAKTQCSLPIL